MHHAFKLGDTEHGVELSRNDRAYRLHLENHEIAVDLKTGADGSTLLSIGPRHQRVHVATLGDQVFVHVDGEAHELRYRHPLTRLAEQGQGSAEDKVYAPMPGSVVAVSVAAGDSVSKNQILLVMESMKMETTITASRDGVVREVAYRAGQSFDRDALLLSLEPLEMKS